MVIRLFVPPGDGEYVFIPKRPDALGANATLQHCIVGSTALAATYTSFASSYRQRLAPLHSISKTALFIRSSARLGLWAAAAGAAINWYHHNAFVRVIVSEHNLLFKPWRLYEWTKAHTVDDGCLAGAAIGLAASISTFSMRRPVIPWWTRCLGMMNIGACAGILGGHGYLQYTGERQKAYERLDQKLERRLLGLREIYWDKRMLAQFNPLVQQYIRHNGIWYTSELPHDAFQQPDNHDGSTVNNTESHAEASIQAEQPPEEQPYYAPPYDYSQLLKQCDIESTRVEMEELKAEKQALLEAAEHLLIFTVQKQHEYCHIKELDDDERQRRLEEIHLCEIAYQRVLTAAHVIDIQLTMRNLSIQHKAITEAHPASDDPLELWLPTSTTIDYKTHDPTLSIQEMKKFQEQFAADIQVFEESIAHPGSQDRKERLPMDLKDARILLKAADHVVWEFEKARKALEEKKAEDEVEGMPAENMEGEKNVVDKGKAVRTQHPRGKDVKPPKGSLDSEKP